MVKNRLKFWRIINILLILVSTAVFVFSYYYLSKVCLQPGDCQSLSRRGILSPLQNASLFLVAIFSFFLFFPQAYLKRYLLRYFWWLFLLGYTFVAATAPVGGSIVALDRTQAVNILGIMGLILTTMFLLFSYRAQKRKLISAV